MHGGAHPSDGLGGLDEAPGNVHELSTLAQRDSRQQVTLACEAFVQSTFFERLDTRCVSFLRSVCVVERDT